MMRPLVVRENKKREGRGYSVAEIRAAGVGLTRVKKLRIPVDLRRRTSHASNVTRLKKLVAEAEARLAERKKKAVRKPAKKEAPAKTAKKAEKPKAAKPKKPAAKKKPPVKKKAAKPKAAAKKTTRSKKPARKTAKK